MKLGPIIFKKKFNDQLGRCYYCGTSLIPLPRCSGGNIEIDHMLPWSKYRNGKTENLCLACINCNQKKAANTIDEFRDNNPELLFEGKYFYFELLDNE